MTRIYKIILLSVFILTNHAQASFLESWANLIDTIAQKCTTNPKTTAFTIGAAFTAVSYFFVRNGFFARYTALKNSLETQEKTGEYVRFDKTEYENLHVDIVNAAEEYNKEVGQVKPNIQTLKECKTKILTVIASHTSIGRRILNFSLTVPLVGFLAVGVQQLGAYIYRNVQ